MRIDCRFENYTDNSCELQSCVTIKQRRQWQAVCAEEYPSQARVAQ